jgi:hypothetical protein
MTSFTKALYRRDPAAALAFYNDSKRDQFEGRKAPSLPMVGFGQRTPSGWVACAQRCGHAACSQGCTLVGRR